MKVHTTTNRKSFDKLATPTQKELLELYNSHMDALQAFDEATDRLEAFQVAKEGDIKEAFDYVTGDLLESIDLPYDVAYIVNALDNDRDQITKKELDLVQIIIRKATFRGREGGQKLYAALMSLGKPVQLVTELQMMQSQIATDHVKIETTFNQRVEQVKADGFEVSKIWEEANPQHPAVIKFRAEQEAAKSSNPLTEATPVVEAKKAPVKKTAKK